MRTLTPIAFALTIIGGLNWGLVGLGGFMGSDWNLVRTLVGAWPVVEATVYVLVGLSALWLLIGKFQGR
ncbi:MAG TPA: DUF378 domain-containing protein [Candidatus Paceibacterota bacterium]